MVRIGAVRTVAVIRGNVGDFSVQVSPGHWTVSAAGQDGTVRAAELMGAMRESCRVHGLRELRLGAPDSSCCSLRHF